MITHAQIGLHHDMQCVIIAGFKLCHIGEQQKISTHTSSNVKSAQVHAHNPTNMKTKFSTIVFDGQAKKHENSLMRASFIRTPRNQNKKFSNTRTSLLCNALSRADFFCMHIKNVAKI